MSQQNNNHYELQSRRSAGDSICRKRDELLDAVRSDDAETFKALLQKRQNSASSDNSNILNQQYETQQYKSLLDIICSEGCARCLDALLQLVAASAASTRRQRNDFVSALDLNRMNEHHKKCPIHFAIESKDLDTVKLLLKQTQLDTRVKCRTKGLISFALKCLNETREDIQNAMNVYEEIVRELLRAGVDPSVPDNKGNTAIHDAARQGQENIVKILLNHNYNNYIANAGNNQTLQLDGKPNAMGKTARQAVIEAFPHLLDFLPPIEASEKPPDIEQLWQALYRHDEMDFLNIFRVLIDVCKTDKERSDLVNATNGKDTLLQAAISAGLHRIIQQLLKSGCDPDLFVASANNSSPALLACRNGDHDTLNLLIASDKNCSLRGPLLQEIAKEIGRENNRPDCNYRECLDILLSHMQDIDINSKDIKGNTALHYAGRNRDDETVLKLLQSGAFIGSRNRLGDPSITDVSADVLERYLDQCIETNGHRPSEDTFTITVRYDCLVPPGKNQVCTNRNRVETSCSVPLVIEDNIQEPNEEDLKIPRFAEEMSAILYMSESEELRRLLKHPVISSFLYLKWHRLRSIFRTNLTLYSTFCTFLVLFILIGYGKDSEDNGPNVHNFSQCLWLLTILGLLMLIIREAFQILISPVRYFRALENYLELGLIGVTIAILFCNVTSESSQQQLSAIAILLSAAELMLLIGQLPTFSTNVVMLRTVSWNFLKFLALNSILIIAFALSFYTLFREDQPDSTVPTNNTKTDANNAGDSEQNFFLHPAMALFKTIVMLTGEFDAGSLKFGVYPITSHIIFVLFVFLIAIVLFNLLNGLAVSDTQAIKSDAQLVGLVCRAQLLNYYETVLMGDINICGNLLHKIKSLFCCIPQDLKDDRKCIRPFARRICLFPCFLPKHRIDIKVNQGNIIVIPDNGINELTSSKTDEQTGTNKDCLTHCYHYKMDFRIVKSMKCILHRLETKSETEYQIIQKLQSKVDAMEYRFGQMEESIAAMLGLLREIPR